MAQSFWFFGAQLTVLADSQITDRRYDLVEGTFAAGMAMPLHRHTAYTEQLFVLDGEFTVHLGEEVFALTAGQTVFVPKGVRTALQPLAPARRAGLSWPRPAPSRT